MRDIRLIRVYLIFRLFRHIVVRSKIPVVKRVWPDNLSCLRIMRHQALRYVGLGSSSPQCIHPLAPGFIECIEAVQLSVKDTAASALILCRFIDLEWDGQDCLFVKAPVLNIFRIRDCLQIHRFSIQIQLIDDIPKSISLVQYIGPSFAAIRSLKDHLLNPVPTTYKFHPLPRVPLQNRIFTDLRINRNLESAITDIQGFLQSFLHFLREFIVLYNFIPNLFLLFFGEIKVIHICQHYGRQDPDNQAGKSGMDLAHLHPRCTF